MQLRRYGRAVMVLLLPLLAGCSLSTVATGTATPTVPAGTTGTPVQIGDPGSYGPSDLRQAYDVNPLIQQGFTGKGQTVVDIVSFGDPTIQTDINDYSNHFGLPAITVKVIAPIGANPQPTTNAQAKDQEGWAGETALDVEMIHALAPDAGIVVLTSPISETEGIQGLPQFRQLVQYAIDNKLGNIISNSWGASEATLTDSASQAELQLWETLLQTSTTTKGITYFASAGDNGCTDLINLDVNNPQLDTTPTTSFVTDSPWVTSVGGTSLTFNGTQGSETVWDTGNGAGGAGGGGFSSFFNEPDYQKSVPSSEQALFQNRRGVPDVAADADPNTGMLLYVNGRPSPGNGGTSAAAPMWAALMAIADQKAGKAIGFINPLLYKIGTSSKGNVDFNDVTSGNNSVDVNGVTVQGYTAAPGWDPASGFGTPNAAKLIPDLIAAANGS